MLGSWGVFWEQEANDLCERLPSLLVGGAPVTVLCYQPAKAERMVYLNRVKGGPSPIYFGVGQHARSLFFDPSLSAVWRTRYLEWSDRDVIRYIDETDEKIREDIWFAETDRYPKEWFDAKGHHYLAKRDYRLHAVFPSPLYHERDFWWRRLPRLGVCYTLSDQLGNVPDLIAEDRAKAAESLLHIYGIGSGNRILGKRLRLALSGYYKWSGDERSTPQPEQRIARLIVTTGISPSDSKTWDQALYLVARLILAHHIFFPQSPVGLQLFQVFDLDPNVDILQPHGWEATTLIPVATAAPDGNRAPQLFQNLVHDLIFLIHALVRWEDPEQVSHRITGSELESTLGQLTRIALILLSGEPAKLLDDRVTLTGHDELQRLGAAPIPVYDAKQFKAILSSPSRDGYAGFMAHLSPIGQSRNDRLFNGIQHGAVVQMEPGQRRGRIDNIVHHTTHEWVSKYMRARFAYKAAVAEGKRGAPVR